MTPTETVLQCLRESGPLTLEALVYESDLGAPTVMTSLLRLKHEGRVQCNGGVFAMFNQRHSDRVRVGKLMSSIPTLGGVR